jgi:hypothetical protein
MSDVIIWGLTRPKVKSTGFERAKDGRPSVIVLNCLRTPARHADFMGRAWLMARSATPGWNIQSDRSPVISRCGCSSHPWISTWYQKLIVFLQANAHYTTRQYTALQPHPATAVSSTRPVPHLRPCRSTSPTRSRSLSIIRPTTPPSAGM